MTFRLAPDRKQPVRPSRSKAAFGALAPLVLCFAGGDDAQAGQPPVSREQQQFCANVAASAETLRLERQRKELAQLESEVDARLQALETRQNELRTIVDRLDAFERSAGEALLSVYSRMKPDAAAAQLAELDEDVAASLMLQLKGKVSSAILSEMPAARGAALVKRISDLRRSSAGRKP